jgi:ribosome-binding factor A
MNSERLKKLENVAQSLISSFILEEMQEAQTEFGLINVSGVKLSSDLSYLDVYVSAFKNPENLTKALAKHNKDIQHRFHKSMVLRKIPRIRYRYDDSGELSQSINNTINSLDI